MESLETLLEEIKEMFEIDFETKILPLEEALNIDEIAELIKGREHMLLFVNAFSHSIGNTHYIILAQNYDFSTVIHEILHYPVKARFPNVYGGKVYPKIPEEFRIFYNPMETWIEAFTYLFTSKYVSEELADKRLEDYLLTNLQYALGDAIGKIVWEKFNSNGINYLIKELDKANKGKFSKELSEIVNKAFSYLGV